MKLIKKPVNLLVLIILLGAILRLIGIWFGLPFTNVHPDEPMLKNVISRILEGEFNTRWYIYPNFFMYIVSIIIFILLFFKFGPSFFENLKNLSLIKKNLLIFKTGRPVSAIFGILLIPLTYKISKLLFNERIGLLSALMIAVNFPLVLHSHYLTTDSTLFFFMLLTLYYSMKYYKKMNGTSLILACISCGISIGTKYTGFVTIILILGVLFIKMLKKKISFGKFIFFSWISVSLVLLFFLITNPFIVFDFDIFKKHFMTVFGVHGIKFSLNIFQNWKNILFIQGQNIIHALGIPGFIFSLLGLIWLGNIAYRYKRYEIMLFISFPVCFFLMVITTNNIDERYISPLIPYLAIASSFFIITITQKLNKFKYTGLIILIVLSISPPLFQSINLDRHLLKEDTKITATKWMKENIPLPLKYYYETQTILSPEKNGRFIRRLGTLSPNFLIKRNIDFIVLNTSYKKYFGEEFQRFYYWVENDCFLIKRFQLKTFQYLNPTIEVYGIDNQNNRIQKKKNILLKFSYKGGENYLYIFRVDRKEMKLLKPTSSSRTIEREVFLQPGVNHSIIIHSTKCDSNFDHDDEIEISISINATEKNLHVSPDSFQAVVKPNHPFISVFKIEAKN